METIKQQITKTFLTRLAESKKLDAATIEQLRILMTDDKKLKVDELVKAFAAPTGWSSL